MKEKVFLKSYCLIGLGDIENIKEDLTHISENNTNFVSGEGLIICTFYSTFNLKELEDFLKINERSYIIFEMLPGVFSANLTNSKFQEALFGGEIDNTMYSEIYDISDGLKDFMKTLNEDLVEDAIYSPIKKNKEFSIDDILDKIGEVGVENLSLEEKEYLDSYSKNK